MQALAILLTAAAALVIAVATAATVVALRTMNGSRHQRRVFGFALFGGFACFSLVVETVIGLTGLRLPGWIAPLGLFQAVVLCVFVIALLRVLRRNEALRQDAVTTAAVNSGTSLPNRHALSQPFQQALSRARRAGAPSCMVALAIDGFGEIAALRGPVIAQDLMRDLAFLLRDFTRSGDVPGHLRPEAVGALLPATGLAAARRMAERLGMAAQERLPHPEMDGRRMTLSFGIAEIGEGSMPAALDEAIAMSELALAQAQKEGGGRIKLADQPPKRSAA